MRIKTVFISILLLLSLISCVKKDKILISINTIEDFKKISSTKDQIALEKRKDNYLTSNEIFNKNYNYYKLNEPYINEKFKIVLLLGKMKEKDNRVILLRTCESSTNKVISSFLLSSYNNKCKECFCKGELKESLKIKRTCNDYSEFKKVNQTGSIL